MFQSLFRNLSPVVKNLLIINGIFFLAQMLVPEFTQYFSLYFYKSSEFRAYQLATHFFMHGGIGHIFFNMFALLMFGPPLERIWGAQRFLAFYFITAFGAAILHQFALYFEINQLQNIVGADSFQMFFDQERVFEIKENEVNDVLSARKLIGLIHTPMLGASGAVFGLLAGFAYYFPNTQLMLLFPPIPIKAKYFVMGYAALELFSGISNRPGDNVAHFAHLGGALFGIILVFIWKKNKHRFY